ncbi:MAG: hypothetical protein IJ570_06475 [Prevotella sp.]|nr:hypothetical protein [Prevotella sp.]
MKRFIFMVVVCLCAVGVLQAQTIRQGQQFFDGVALYVVYGISQNGTVKMMGSDSWGGVYELALEAKGAPGRYVLKAANAAPSPFRCLWGSEVEYIRQEGMNFLAVKDGKGRVVETLVLTPDNLIDCSVQQEQMERDAAADLASACNDMLLNTHMLMPLDLEPIKQEAARLGKLSRPSIIQRINVQLLNSEIDYRNGQAEGGYDNPDGLGADGRGEDEVD